MTDIEQEESLPPEIEAWLKEKLQLFRSADGTGMLELYIQDGHIYTYRDSYFHRTSGRIRYRTTDRYPMREVKSNK